MKLKKMFCAFMSRFATAAVMCCIALSQCLSAATLNVEFDVRTRAVEGDSAQLWKNVAIFVLDRSTSMNDPPVGKVHPSIRTRNDQLKASVVERAEVIARTEPNTDVYLLPFSTGIHKMVGPFSMKEASSLDLIRNWKGFNPPPNHQQTLLYDTLAYALSLTDDFTKGNQRVRVQIYGYTDGGNFTQWPKFLNENLGKDGETIRVRFRTSKVNRPDLVEKAYRAFTNQYEKEIRDFIVSGKLKDDIQWRWLGEGKPPPGIKNTRKDEYEMLLTSASQVLKSLSAIPEQQLGVELTVPIPSQYENSLSDLLATTALEISGKRISGKFISLQPGKHIVTFQIPDDLGANAADGKLSIADVPDAWERMILKPPTPLELTFAAPGKLSFLDIDPKGEFYVKKGSTKEFKAKATENADIHWSWPGGSNNTHACPITFTATTPDPFEVLVTAKKKGFLSVEEKIKVHVIDAHVGVSVVTSRPMVGDAIVFLAKAHGQPESYSWKIDNQIMPGRDAGLKVPVFSGGSGPHVVSVRAYYGHDGIMADSGDVPFVVAAKPYVEIVEPDSGNEYPFGEKFECKANVEGDFDKVVWELDGPAGEKQESAVDKTAKASRSVSFKPAKGGKYTLKATAVGAAGSLPAKASVVLKVAYENLGINITSHASGTPVQLGRNAENLNLVAEVTGDKITKAKWFVRKESGEESEIRVTPVQRENGKRVAKCSFSPDPSTQDGSSLFVRVEAVFDGDAPSEPVVSPSIELIATRYAEIELEAKVNGGEANGREVRFGDQVDLKAKCKGDIDENQVQWYISTYGVVSKIPVRGSQCMSPKEVPNGESLRTVRYFAVANLPDGSAVTSRMVVVHHHCPDVKCSIGLPRAGGVMRTSFGRAEAFDVQLEDEEGRLLDKLTDVKWDFGDGMTADTPVFHRPAYGKYDEFTIKASGKCPKCGTRYYATPVKIKIEKQPAKAVLEILEKGSRFGTGDTINLCATNSTGDIVAFVWEVNGEEIAKGRGQEKIAYKLPSKPCDMVFTLKAVGPDGDVSEDQRGIRVRNGLLGIGLIALSVLVIVVLALLLLNNGSAGWKVKMYCCAAIDHSTNDGITQELGMISDVTALPADTIWGLKYWGFLSKKLTLPFEKVLSDESLRKFLDQNTEDFMLGCKDEGITVDPNPDSGKDSIYSSSDSLRLEPYKPDDEMGMREQLREKKLYTIDYRQFCDSNDDQKDLHVFRFIVDRSKEAYRYAKYFVVLTFCVIVAAVWAALKCAI